MRRPFLLSASFSLILSALFSACTQPISVSPSGIPPVLDTATATPTETPTPTATSVTPPGDTPTFTPTPTPTSSLPAYNTPTPTATGCDKVNVTVDSLPANPVSAGTTVIGFRFTLGNYFGGNCSAYNHSFTGMSFSPGFPTGNLASEFVEAQLWSGSSLATGTLLATSSSIGPVFNGAPALGSDGSYFIAYVFSSSASGVIQTSLYGLAGYGTGGGSIWVPNPPALPVAGAPLTIGAPAPTPTATPTRTPTPAPPGSCAPLSITCVPDGSGNLQAAGYPVGNPGTESVTCISMNGSIGGVYTNTLDAATDPEDIYTVGLAYLGQPICVLLDSFDDGSGTNRFTLGAFHCMGTDRSGPGYSWCGGAVQGMTTGATYYDSNVTIRVRAQQGSGPYRLIILAP